MLIYLGLSLNNSQLCSYNGPQRDFGIFFFVG